MGDKTTKTVRAVENSDNLGDTDSDVESLNRVTEVIIRASQTEQVDMEIAER